MMAVLTAAFVAVWTTAGQAATPTQQPAPSPASSITVDGQVVVLGDTLPRQDTAELRPSVLIDLSGTLRRIRFKTEFAVEGLVSHRDRDGFVTDAAVRGRDIWAEISGGRAELRGGFGRVIWGRLDEIQPTDVVNPLDTARFLLDGRSEARLPVGFVRGRVFAGETLVIEGVLVPWFRRASFDQRDEPTSPFNLVNDAILPQGVTASREVRQDTPTASWANVSGGSRVSGTIGRLDVAVAAFRGFDGFGPITFEVAGPGPVPPLVVGQLVESHPRFTMIGGDFETILGKWALRGEIATFPERHLAGVTRPGLVRGSSVDAGLGFDRRTGDYRIFGSVMVHQEWADDDPAVEREDWNLVGSIERPFRRDRWLVRVFAIVNPGDQSSFLRGLVSWKPRDNVSVEASGGAFLGTSDDTIGRFKGRDFLFGRLKYHF
jgi:hypothetical protein